MPPPTMRRMRLIGWIWASAARLRKVGCLGLDNRWWDDARGKDSGEGITEHERATFDLGTVGSSRQQMVELHLADDVARAVAGLAEVEQLLKSNQAAGCVRPSARR